VLVSLLKTLTIKDIHVIVKSNLDIGKTVTIVTFIRYIYN